MSLCPRCQRPLDDDEPYICCAGVELRWRCADCHKVSEGFAFPYGLCPHCKGKLELLDRGAIEDDQAMEAVRKAFEIELGGHAFYERASRDAKDPVLRELFGRFAGMIFAGVDRKPEDPANLFRIAIAFEQRAVDFFTREGERAPAGSVESELYKELAAEEREHVALLSTEYRRWEAGKAGIL